MTEDTKVPITLVWLETTAAPGKKEAFPEKVLECIEEEFHLSPFFTSKSRPTAVGMLEQEKYASVKKFIDDKYPQKISLGYLY